MIEPILPKARTTAGVSILGLQTSPAPLGYQPQLAVAGTNGNGQPRFAEPIIPAAPPIPEPFDFDSSIDDFDPIEETEDVEKLSYSDLEMSFDPSEEGFNPATEPAQSPAQLQQSVPDSYEAQDNNSSYIEPVEPVIEVRQADAVRATEPGVDEAVEPQTSADLTYEGQSEVIHQENKVSDGVQGDGAPVTHKPQANDYASATDPWNDPLPAWDQSQNEWPVMLAPDKRSAMKKLRVPVAITLVIASGVAAYFLFFRQAGGAAPTQQSAAAQEPLKVGTSTPETEKAKAANEQSPAQALASAETTEIAQAQQNNETAAAESEGRFTLQMASMPNEAAANGMAGKLKSDGLPAYVVRADLGSRGIWFRVRVGQFKTAEEAKSFAAKSRLEARVERNDN